jgi:hypothetical protein
LTSPDAILGRYRVDLSNVVHLTVVSQTVPVRQGLHRQGFLDLGSDVGSSANATQTGTNWLADHANPTNAGTLTIARPMWIWSPGA